MTGILIVEDKHIVALDIRSSLERNGFLVVGQADRGEYAVEMATERNPDLVLIDIGLKGQVDGIDAAIQIRKQLDLPIIFLTAFGSPTVVERARLAEPFAYIFKPFEEHELVSNIRMALHKHELEKKLRESENKFRSVIEHSSDGIVLADKQGNISEWNPAAEQISGLPRSEVIAQPLWKVIFRMLPEAKRTTTMHEALRSQWNAMVEKEYTGNLDQLIEIEIETPQGVRRVVQNSRFAIKTIQGVMVGTIMRDVTERKQAQEAISNSEKRFRALIENGRDNISLLAADGSLLWESPSVTHTLGYPPNQYLGRNIFEIMHPEDVGWTKQLFMQVVQNPGSSQEGTFRLLRSDGAWRWIEATATNLLQEPSVNAIIINYRDITERRQTEAELRKVLQAVEQSANTIVITDADGRIEYANPKFVEVSGYTLDEVLGRNPRLLNSGIHPPEFYQNLWQTIKAGHVWRGEVRNRRKDGTLYWEDSTITPVFDLSHNLVNFIAVKEDITHRKTLEEAERNQRLLAEALRDTSTALNGTLKLEEVLDRVLDNVGKLITFDTAMVVLIEGHSVRTIRHRSLDRQEIIHESTVGHTQVNLINIAILQEMRETRLPCVITDTQTDTRWRAIPGMSWVRSCISAPIMIRGYLAGVIIVLSSTSGFFTSAHSERLMIFAGQSAIAIENAQLFEQAYYLSVTDPLTELINRRHFFDVGRLEFERAHRYQRTLSVMMVDVDHFKHINDTFGHAVGDLTLREIAARIVKVVRTTDIVARFGGEEFIVLMPETSLEEAYRVAERVRQSVSDIPIEEESDEVRTTLSIGIAELSPENRDIDQLLKRADQALYEAKAMGRNRVVVSQNA